MVTGECIELDDQDYSYVFECYDLKVDSHGYVQCKPKKKYRRMGLHSLSLHKLLANPEKKGRSVVVDHYDGNKLNHRRENLRVTSHTNNMRNRKVSKLDSKTSLFKGVSWHTEYNRWRCQINVNLKRIMLGYFQNELAAANCYNYWAIEYFGDFALLNEVHYMSRESWEKYKAKKNKTSQYIGVSYVDNKWLAQIYHDKRNIRVGSFLSEFDAGMAYNEKAVELKGNKARLNKIHSKEQQRANEN